MRIDYLVEIYKRHNDLLRTTLNYKKIIGDDVFIMHSVATKIQKQVENQHEPILLFLFLDKAYHHFSKHIQDIVNKQEKKLKNEHISNLIQEARDSGNVLYLCSRHDDSAKDHKDWQGEIYIDENFDLYNHEAYEFIKNKKYNTIQWVLGDPVWMTTRPYCRHYFKSISLEEARELSVADLLKKYKMSHKVGPRQPDVKKRNIEIKLDFYKTLYRVAKNDSILNKIKLYKKYLKNNY